MQLTHKSSTLELEKWSGPKRHYDLVKEITVVSVVVAVLTVSLALLFGSGDPAPVTMRSWAQSAPADFVGTAATELAGTSGTATYGPPYNRASDGQVLGPLKIQKFVGVHLPVDTASDFVITPLRESLSAPVATALTQWSAASETQRAAWSSGYADALAAHPDATFVAAPRGTFGPAPTLLNGLLQMARTGALDSALAEADGSMSMDYTKRLLFLGDSGSYFPDLGAARQLGGDQWGMTNEPGAYPGQPWLIFVSVWYQIDPFLSSENADIQILALVAAMGLVLIFLPLIPGLRRIPMWIPVHRVIWRKWYQKHPSTM